jgi:hypothetical protein
MPRNEAENAMTSKLTQEEDSTTAYGEMVVDRKELTSRSQVATDSEKITIPEHNKRCRIFKITKEGILVLWFTLN